jgi:hypothetical protein
MDERCPGSLRAAEELVELQMDCLGVAVLGVLDQEDRQDVAIVVP